ncbi:MAG: hypothetical protein ACO3IZ_00660 [Steroidobacteraceae bacterium]
MTQHRIAVIEDDSILREDLVDYLDLQGHAVVDSPPQRISMRPATSMNLPWPFWTSCCRENPA